MQRRAKRPAGGPGPALARPVTTVGVVGAGLMASQLALLFVHRLEVPVVLTDLDQERVDAGVGRVHGEIDALLGKGRINQDRANRLKALVTGSTTTDAFAGGRLRDRGGVRGAVGQAAGLRRRSSRSSRPSACWRPTPPRSRSPRWPRAGAPRAGRRLPLLQPGRRAATGRGRRGAEQTDDASLATAFAVGKALRKSCVLVKDAPAFVVNRLLTRFLGEVMASVDEGTPHEVAEAAVAPLGLPIVPFVLLQLVGPAVALHVARDDARGVPGPVRGLGQPGPDRRGRQARRLLLGRARASRSSTTRPAP